jgi:hypothetical protein
MLLGSFNEVVMLSITDLGYSFVKFLHWGASHSVGSGAVCGIAGSWFSAYKTEKNPYKILRLLGPDEWQVNAAERSFIYERLVYDLSLIEILKVGKLTKRTILQASFVGVCIGSAASLINWGYNPSLGGRCIINLSAVAFAMTIGIILQDRATVQEFKTLLYRE